MNRDQVFNFAAGPAILPDEVLEIAGKEMLNYRGSGMSVMEMSHRSSVYIDIFDSTKAKLKAALDIPDSHEILFLQGGASLQFSMIPMNLLGADGSADYAVTGNFASNAYIEAQKFGAVRLAASSEDRNHTYIPAQDALDLDPNAKYFYYTANNTIYGTEWKYVPETNAVPLVSDMSSNILSKPVDVSKYGLIFAGAQKNMGPAGVTVVIIDKALAGHELPNTPTLLSYKRMIDTDSMYNTPPCYSIYIVGLVLDWLERQGGVAGMEKIKSERAKMLYDFLDNSSFYIPCAETPFRSDMNLTFKTADKDLDAAFAKEAAAQGIENIAGHRSVGGMRASLYNAMPMRGVEKLIEFMKDFEVRN